MPRIAAGLLMFRVCDGRVEVLLVHPGGPFFAKRDAGVWTVPKGEPNAGELASTDDELLAIARREFAEETGISPTGEFLALGSIVQKGGKRVHAWAFRGDCDAAACQSNLFEMEWPPKSGRRVTFPEVDRAEWFDLDTARAKIKESQIPLLDRLEVSL
ncbi:NUDIX domain-containing protein [Aeoliella sp. SH292]|uniref:NUDIX domain-containing protein n=1 Tax=Aeoliella sp. SH292 TaxID=3454464 RepID=UPI003F96E67D